MQRLTYVVFITTTEKDSASRRQPCVLPAQLAISLVHQSRSQTNDCGLWSWNEKMCPHAYKITACNIKYRVCTYRQAERTI